MNFSNNVISHLYLDDCGEPVSADGVVIHDYTTTFEGSSITFTCEDGLFPNDIITATCTGEGHWSTDPATYMCTTTTTSTTNPGITTTVIDNTNANMTTGEVQYCNTTPLNKADIANSVQLHS